MLKILVFKSGLLGDTLVALPALNCLRESFPDAKITYLWQEVGCSGYVTPVDVLFKSGLVNNFYGYKVSRSIIKSILNYIKLWFYCVFERFDIGIVLEPQYWPGTRKTFLKLCGIKTVIGPDGIESHIFKDGLGRLPVVEKISDSLVGVLKPLDISLPLPEMGRFDLRITEQECANACEWLLQKGFEVSDSTRFVAVAIGSNMPSKRWPLNNYSQLVDQLIKSLDVIPIVFGGKDDVVNANHLIMFWGRGINAAGELGIREGVALMKQCNLFVGNDTGTMHMAVAASLPCVAIFSSIDMPGRWEPYGSQHSVIRVHVECEGCLLRECNKAENQCINKIQVEDVLDKCIKIFQNKYSDVHKC